ncbi:MAG: hypothetical protein Q8909_09395 [Bacteroidota bacterium]|nr:hypothetical protein [Bacteroidota bacterium]
MFGEEPACAYPEAQLSLFDAGQGTPVLEEESSVFSTLVEEIKQKAEQRRNAQKTHSVSQKRTCKIPDHIERRETVIYPENFDADKMVRIGEDVTERLMLEPSKFWVERTIRPVYKIPQTQESLSSKIVQAHPKQGILPGCMADESLLSQIIIDKFLYHIPEY